MKNSQPEVTGQRSKGKWSRLLGKILPFTFDFRPLTSGSPRRLVTTIVFLCVLSVAAGAQLLDGKRRVGDSPTPGTPQPEHPNLADRVTLTGCVQPATARSGQQTGPADPNTPSDSRYVLTSAERQNIVPAGTGGSPLTAQTSSRTYRLEAIDAQLSPFVGTKVEISGQIKSVSTPATGDTSSSEPTLQVEFVQKIAATCP
jgi:hypothetical protein